jgi:protein phosphatase
MTSMPGFCVQIHGATDIGQVRQHNEDAIGFDADQGILVLADGVGGQAGGEVASQLAVDGCLERVAALLDQLRNTATQTDSAEFPAQLLAHLGDHLQVCNALIFSESLSRPGCQGMSTTLVLAVLYGGHLFYCHLGDSRLYRLRQGVLEQLTRDHSLVQEMEEAFGAGHGALVPANIITRAMGASIDCNPDCAFTDVKDADLFLLCSDGLSNYLDHIDLQGSLSPTQPLVEQVNQLIAEANRRGGRDNISAILARVERL